MREGEINEFALDLWISIFLESDLPFHHSSSIWLKWHVIISLTCNHLRILWNDFMYFSFVFIHPISWNTFYILVYICISTKAQWAHFVGKKNTLSFACIRKKKNLSYKNELIKYIRLKRILNLKKKLTYSLYVCSDI